MKETKKMGRPSKKTVSDAELLKLYTYFSASQLAQIYNVSENTVRSWVHRIKKKQELKAGE